MLFTEDFVPREISIAVDFSDCCTLTLKVMYIPFSDSMMVSTMDWRHL